MLNEEQHKIYKERGRMNMQIGLVLLVCVFLIAFATIARLSSGNLSSMSMNSRTNIEVSE